MIHSTDELAFFCPQCGGSVYQDAGIEGVTCDNCKMKIGKHDRWNAFVVMRCSKFNSPHEFEETLLRLALEARKTDRPIALPS